MKILVLYYSTWGHVEDMAEAEDEGAREIEGFDVLIKRVPESMTPEILKKIGAKSEQKAPIAHPDELAEYDAIIFGNPTRFGSMTGQMRNFLDRTGNLWQSGKLIGKVASVFTSTATQHGGQETTITSFHSTLLHHGMIIVGVPYSCAELMNTNEMSGGSPYGAGTIAGSDGGRHPSNNELAIARFQGKHVASITKRLFGN